MNFTSAKSNLAYGMCISFNYSEGNRPAPPKRCIAKACVFFSKITIFCSERPYNVAFLMVANRFLLFDTQSLEQFLVFGKDYSVFLFRIVQSGFL